MLQLADKVDSFGNWFRSHGIRILVVLLVAVLVTFLARFLVRRFQRKLEGAPSVTQVLNLQRITTITHTLTSAAIVAIWTIAILIVLGEFEIDLAPLLTSAAILGVALGFGAQSIVKDALSGFFILVENQFGVGDVVEAKTTAGPVSGRVEDLTLRVTSLRAFDGTLHVVPNGNIQVISNRSRGWARAIVDVRLAYAENLDHVREVLDELFEEVRLDPALREAIKDGPSLLGVETLADYGQVVRVTADTRPSKRQEVERQLRERIARRLDERGIKVPIPPPAPATPQPPADGVSG